jgi:hypothetical protein
MTNRTADVYPYDSSYKPMTNIPIVTGATAWDDPNTNITYILVIHEGLYYGTQLDHTLLNPNQLRHYGIGYWDNPYDKSHNLEIEISTDTTIELYKTGTRICFDSRVPTLDELNSCIHINLTSNEPWNPNEVVLGKVSSQSPVTPNDFKIQIKSTKAQTEYDNSFHYYDPTSDEALLHETNPILVNLKELIIQSTHVNNGLIPDEVPSRRTFVSNKRHGKKTADSIAELWCIGPKRAKATLNATTQRGIRSAILPLSRRYRADRMYNLKRLNGRFATDTLYADIKSLNQHKYAQMFTHKNGFAVCYPIDRLLGNHLGYAFRDFIHDYGIPEHLTMDGASNQTGSNTMFMQLIRKHNIKHHVSSPRRANENPAEGSIREVKKRWYRVMKKMNVPHRLWDFGLIWICETGNLTVSSSRYANGRTPLEIITGETPDISEYLDFTFYDWVIYNNNAGLGENCLGRWLGVSHKVGQLMSYWVLTIAGNVISCVDVQRLTNDEKFTDDWQEQMTNYNSRLTTRMIAKDTDNKQAHSDVPNWNKLSIDQLDQSFVDDFNKVISDESIKDADDYTPDTNDSYLKMELGLPREADDNLQHAVVKKRALDNDGKPIGTANDNPLMDSRMYEVEFIDGTIEILPANIIAENILSQVDSEGHRQLFIDEIIDHRKTKDAIDIKDGFTTTKYGTKRLKRTTKGWELCIIWKDGSTNWVALKDMKHSYPVQVADYVQANNLAHEPAFAWWVPYVQKKRKAIISKIKSKYWQRTHKYGVRIPKTVKEAYEIDRQNGDKLWTIGIEKEMKKIRDAFKIYNDDPSTLIGYQEITTHWIFDIKMGENFRRKARLVGDGHKTATPSSVTYSSVVSRDSVRICLLIAALNDLHVFAADIENAYLTAPCREKCWTRAGREFGSDEGKILIVEKALYGLKSSGAAFRAFLAETLDNIGFKSSEADPDVWLRPAVKPDGEKFYEYMLVYVDDLLSIHYGDESRAMKEVQAAFKFKNDEIAVPEFYLGGKLEEKNLNDTKCWTMTSRDYVKASIDNIEIQLKQKKLPPLRTKIDTPMSSNYTPETDLSTELNAEDITFFQEMIGMLRWAIELGRVDILLEVSMLSAYQAAPRQGHLDQLLHIFAFLKKKPKLTLYFDPSLPNIDESIFTLGTTAEGFKEQYRDAEEMLPERMPTPRGRQVTITSFVDASHAANKATRRSHTGFIIFVNRAPIIWFSKRQNTVESSTFSSEFIAMRTCLDHITALRYKLRMFGIPIDGPTKVLCDNQSVVNNSSKIESALNKKHSSIAYHAVRWAVAAGVITVGKIHTNDNLADAMTKRLTAAKRDYLFGNWTY